MPIDVKAKGVAQLIPPRHGASYRVGDRYFDANGMEVSNPDQPRRKAAPAKPAPAEPSPPPAAAEPAPPAEQPEAPAKPDLPPGDMPDIVNMKYRDMVKLHRTLFGQGPPFGTDTAGLRMILLQAYDQGEGDE